MKAEIHEFPGDQDANKDITRGHQFHAQALIYKAALIVPHIPSNVFL